MNESFRLPTQLNTVLQVTVADKDKSIEVDGRDGAIEGPRAGIAHHPSGDGGLPMKAREEEASIALLTPPHPLKCSQMHYSASLVVCLSVCMSVPP